MIRRLLSRIPGMNVGRCCMFSQSSYLTSPYIQSHIDVVRSDSFCVNNFKEYSTTSFFEKYYFKNNENNENNDEEEKEEPNKSFFRPSGPYRPNLISMIITGIVYYYLFVRRRKPSLKENTLDIFLEDYLGKKNVVRVLYHEKKDCIYVFLKREQSEENTQVTKGGKKNLRNIEQSDYYVKLLDKPSFLKRLRKAEMEVGMIPSECLEIHSTGNFSIGNVIMKVAVANIFIIFLIYMMSRSGNMGAIGGGGGGIGRDYNDFTRMFVEKDQNVEVRFDDVAGMKEAKAEIFEFVEYLQQQKDFERLGAKLPRGAILFGPPGVGKTLLAKALAGESDVPFYAISGSDFVEVYVGVGASRVRDLFEQAREDEQAIIFIDEIDAIGRPRGLNAMYGGGSDERANTLNQLLIELDGCSERDNVVVIGSTNVDKDGLDQALLRPGRFDREIFVERPDLGERMEIFELYLGKYKVGKALTKPEREDSKQVKEDEGEEDDYESVLKKLASLTVGMTGADISTIVNESGYIAVREGRNEISVDDVLNGIDRVIGGVVNSDAIIGEEEREILATHLAGHAITSRALTHGDPFLKISLSQRGGKFGETRYFPSERNINTLDRVNDLMVQKLGGRAAEEIMYSQKEEVKMMSIHNCCLDDLRDVTRMGYMAVSRLGMSDQVVPVAHEIPGSEQETIQKSYGSKKAEKIDEMVKNVIDEAYSKAFAVLQDNFGLLKEITEFLLENETLTEDEFDEILEKGGYQISKV